MPIDELETEFDLGNQDSRQDDEDNPRFDSFDMMASYDEDDDWDSDEYDEDDWDDDDWDDEDDDEYWDNWDEDLDP